MGATVFPEALVQLLRPHYRLPWNGIHGWAHWVRVRANGLRLAEVTGADAQVVELFALFHDIARWDDGWDAEHGRRAAALVEAMAVELSFLSEDQRGLLQTACALHVDGLVEGDVTVQTCWDADRLDLPRVGIRPDPRLLCTEAAREAAGGVPARRGTGGRE